MQKIILASTSPYRKDLLRRLGLPFETARPEVDESRLKGESAEALVARLSEAKARAVSKDHPDALIIGSDQVAVLENSILGKPGDHNNAVRQLRQASGKRVTFLTGLCVLNTRTDKAVIEVTDYSVTFRQLSEKQIENYLLREKPYDCAGSFKSEGLGITLFERMEGDDPNSLVGLPLIELINLLAANGIDVLAESAPTAQTDSDA